MEKKLYKKRNLWGNAAEYFLIEIWRAKMEQLRGARKNAHIIEEMVMELQQQGVMCTPNEVKVKMHNLTARYKKEKARIGPSGGSPSDWPLYADMRTLLAPYKSYHTEILVEDSISEINISIPESVSADGPLSPTSTESVAAPSPLPSPSSLPSPSPSTSTSAGGPIKKGNFQKQILKKLEKFENDMAKCCNEFAETNSELKEISQQILQTETRKADLLEDFVKDSKEVNKSLIAFLKK